VKIMIELKDTTALVC